MKIIKQNKTFLSIIIALFVLFGVVLYLGEKQIYEAEAKWRHGNAISQLFSAKEVIKVFFSDLKKDLFFLKNFPSTKKFIDNDFESISYRNDVQHIFFEFAKVYKQYHQIRIINSSGREIIKINNNQDGTTVIVPDSLLQNKKHSDYFQEAMTLDKGKIYASPIDLKSKQGNAGTSYTPVIRLATPLFDSKNRRKGVLILNINLSKVLELFPRNIFLRTEEGDLLSLKSDGTINFNKSNYDFSGSSGRLDVSEVETIHYSTVKYLPGKRLVVAIYHKHPLLKAALEKIRLVSAIFLILFLCLISIVVYINILRFKELIGAQKAVLFSLAGLAEWRDAETGHHLERTRNYAVILAKELRKNKKYRKVITDEFIEDLYDAASLHDIGKVGIRDSILLKEGKLTNEEFEEMKRHVIIGKQVLQDAVDKFNLKQSFITMGKNICAYHHEKYNGKGYPEGLKGEEIPLEARIFALCDAYDAIRSKRPYKQGLSHAEAVKRIKAASGEHFDPDIVVAFLKCEKEFMKETFS